MRNPRKIMIIIIKYGSSSIRLGQKNQVLLIHIYKLYSVFFLCLLVGFLTLSFSSQINAVLCPQRVSLPLKKKNSKVACSQRAIQPIGCDSPLQIVMAVFDFELAGSDSC
jgi:hypothetical protein